MLTIRISEDDLKELLYCAVLDYCDKKPLERARLPEMSGDEIKWFSERVTDDLIERVRTRE